MMSINMIGFILCHLMVNEKRFCGIGMKNILILSHLMMITYMDFMKRIKRLMLVGFLFKQKILKFFSLNLKIMNILIY